MEYPDKESWRQITHVVSQAQTGLTYAGYSVITVGRTIQVFKGSIYVATVTANFSPEEVTVTPAQTDKPAGIDKEDIPPEGDYEAVIIWVEDKEGKSGKRYTDLSLLLRRTQKVLHYYIVHDEIDTSRYNELLAAVFWPGEIQEMADQINQPPLARGHALCLTWGETLYIRVRHHEVTFGRWQGWRAEPRPIKRPGHGDN